MPAFDTNKSVYEQLRDRLRDLIATGAISPGARMPSQRILARDLSISRNTVIAAYDALTSEGLLEGRSGAGTYVAEKARPASLNKPLARTKDPTPEAPLHYGAVALDLFPIDTWRRIQERVWKQMTASDLSYGDPAGWSGLRYIIAQRLAAIRGVHCTPEQVQIVPTAMQALRLACAALDVGGRRIWVEEICLDKVVAALRATGAELVALPVDEEGADIQFGLTHAPDAALAYLAPTTQFPLGMPLSDRRRAELMAWAQSAKAWVIEDDYEAELSFEGAPPPPLAADAAARERVLHIGTLNNLLFPSAQLAYVVVPDVLIDAIARARRTFDYSINAPLQRVVHDFIDAGHLAAHLRRCLEVYGERRLVARRACEDRLGDVMTLQPQPRGLHVAAYLKAGIDDEAVTALAAQRQLVVHPFSQHRASEAAMRPGLFFGFGGYTPRTLQHSIEKLASAFAAAR